MEHGVPAVVFRWDILRNAIESTRISVYLWYQFFLPIAQYLWHAALIVLRPLVPLGQYLYARLCDFCVASWPHLKQLLLRLGELARDSWPHIKAALLAAGKQLAETSPWTYLYLPPALSLFSPPLFLTTPYPPSF